MIGRVARNPLSGAQVIAALAAIALATAVVPPAAAWSLNHVRVSQTRKRVDAAGEQLRVRAAEVGRFARIVSVACGSGRLPRLVPATATARAVVGSQPAHAAWLSEATRVSGLFDVGMPTDAWGQCFLLNIGNWDSGQPVWLLSAGPNGLIETPLSALDVGGDDVGVRVR